MALRLANQFSTDFALWTTCASGATQTTTFGFDANHVRVLNYAGVPLHLNLASTAVATTDDPELAVGERLSLSGVFVSGISLTTSSTSTSTTGATQRVVVSAWGGI